MSRRIVLDANVVISGIINPSGSPGRLLQLWVDGAIQVILSPPLMDEMLGVLMRDRFARLGPAEQRRTVLLGLFELAEIIFPSRQVALVDGDDPDNRVLEAAETGRADFIVSGDHHLLALGSFEGIPILDPASFLEAFLF